ncbi:hypothetical protein BGZ76_004366 [Entomortierella beljakovae]|nr:hypothetical protein BGZ76_004366 [Entomortierella beljakovae]
MDHSTTNGFSSGLGTSIWSPNLTPTSEAQYIGALIGLFILSIGFRALVAAQGYLEAYLHLHYYPRPTSSSHTRNHQYSNTLQDSQNLHSSQFEQKDQGSSQQSDTLDEKNGDVDISKVVQVRHRNKNLNEGNQGQGDIPQGDGITCIQTTQFAQTITASTTTTTTTKFRQYKPYRRQQYSEHPMGPPLHLLPTAQPFIWQAEVMRAVLTTGVIGIGYMLMLVIMTYNSAYFGVILGGVFVGEIYFGRWGRARPVFPSTRSTLSNEKRVNGYPYQLQDHNVDQNSTERPSPGAVSSISLSSKSSSHGFPAIVHHDGSC